MRRQPSARPLRLLAALAAVALLGSGCGWAQARARGLDDGRPLVVTTISILADLTREVAGDHVVVESLVEIGGDPHTYEPVPSDAGKISDADLILRNGLGLEHWLDTLIDASSVPRPVATVTDGIEPLTIAGTGSDPDPHLWMDPVAVRRYVEAISSALSDLDPANAQDFRRNARRYIRRLDRLDTFVAAQLATIPAAQRRLVTTHDAFRYFGQRYGLQVVGTIWSVSTEREPSATEVAALVDAVRSQGVPAVFVETTINPDLMEQVARDAGVGVGPPLYGDSLGAPGSGADTYLRMMRANTAALVIGLGGGGGSPGRSAQP